MCNVRHLKWFLDRHCYLDDKRFYASDGFFQGTFSLQSFIRLLQVINDLIKVDFIICLLICKPADVTNSSTFAKVSTIGKPLLMPFYTFLNADFSGARKDIKKRSTVSFTSFFFGLSCKKIKILIS